MESSKDIRKRVASIRALSPVDATAVEAVPDKKTAKKLFGDFGCVRNASDGYEVRFSKESVGKILRHRGFDQTSILAVLDKVFVGSLWAWDDPVRFEEGKSARGLSIPDNNRAKVASALLTDDRLVNWFASVNGDGLGRRLRVLRFFVIVATGLFLCPAFLCSVFCVVDIVESRHLDFHGLMVAVVVWLPVIALLGVWHWIDSRKGGRK